MKKTIIVLVVAILLFLSGLGIYKKNNIEVSLENNRLIIDVGFSEKYNGMLDSSSIDKVDLNSYQVIKESKDKLIILSLNYTETEERGDFESILIFLYRDSEITCLLDGYNDYVFQDKRFGIISLSLRICVF